MERADEAARQRDAAISDAAADAAAAQEANSVFGVCFVEDNNNDIGIQSHILARAPGEYQYIWLMRTALYHFLSGSRYSFNGCMPKKM